MTRGRRAEVPQCWEARSQSGDEETGSGSGWGLPGTQGGWEGGEEHWAGRAQGPLGEDRRTEAPQEPRNGDGARLQACSSGHSQGISCCGPSGEAWEFGAGRLGRRGWKQGSCPPANPGSGIRRASRGCKELSWLPASESPQASSEGPGLHLGSGQRGHLTLHPGQRCWRPVPPISGSKCQTGLPAQQVQLSSGPWRRAWLWLKGRPGRVRGKGWEGQGLPHLGGTVPALALGLASCQ